MKGFGKYLDLLYGIRTEVIFGNTYHNMPSFGKIEEFLGENNFRLANLDYDGKGSPQDYLTANSQRFGILCGSEAVFIRSDEYYLSLDQNEFLKALIFFFSNHLHDYAILLINQRHDSPLISSKETHHCSFIEKKFLKLSKSIENISQLQHEKSISDYERFFGKEYPHQHMFYRYLNMF